MNIIYHLFIKRMNNFFILLCLVELSIGSAKLRTRASGSSSSPDDSEKEGPILSSNPVFNRTTRTKESALQYHSAELHCIVHNLGNKSVKWFRQRDLHNWTVDRNTITSGEYKRIEVIHSKGSQDWILKIKDAKIKDSGDYECQISTKIIRSHSVHLEIIHAPKADIIGAPDLDVNLGSTINLTCVISTHQPPAYIFWYHDGEVLSNHSQRGGITVVPETANSYTGYLLIENAKGSDSGNYSCKPTNTGPTYIGVHVLSGELPPAKQTSGGAVKPHNFVHLVCFIFVFYIFVQL